MQTSPFGAVRLVPEPPALSALHAEEMPQKDQLCGAFWGTLALAAAGHRADQDEVALRAGTSLATGDPSEWLPPGASPRTDYRLAIPVAEDEPSSGTSATGVARAVEELSEGALAVVPVAGFIRSFTSLGHMKVATRVADSVPFVVNSKSRSQLIALNRFACSMCGSRW